MLDSRSSFFVMRTATGGFTAAMVGNGININGTIYEIVSRQSTNQITIDRNGPNGTGLTLRVGGALQSLSAFSANRGGSNSLWIRAGTYQLSSTWDVGVNLVGFIRGYGVTRGDGGRPVLKAVSSGFSVISSSGAGDAHAVIQNLEIDGNSLATSGINILRHHIHVVNCEVYGCTAGGIHVGVVGSSIISCLVRNCTSSSGVVSGLRIASTTVRNNTGPGVGLVAGQTLCNNVVSYSNTGDGFYITDHQIHCVNCTAFGNGGSGFYRSSAPNSGVFINCLSYGNTGWGFNVGSSSRIIYYNCAAGGNTSGQFSSLSNCTGIGNITLTANPFVDPSNGDFRLNNLPGGGALCRAAGTGPVGQISALDIGVVQTASGGNILVFEDD